MAKLSVFPVFSTSPSTITFLLTNIANNAKVVCFALDGNNYYGGCQGVEGRYSVQVQYKDVRVGSYLATATVDDKVIARIEVVVTGLD